MKSRILLASALALVVAGTADSASPTLQSWAKGPTSWEPFRQQSQPTLHDTASLLADASGEMADFVLASPLHDKTLAVHPALGEARAHLVDEVGTTIPLWEHSPYGPQTRIIVIGEGGKKEELPLSGWRHFHGDPEADVLWSISVSPDGEEIVGVRKAPGLAMEQWGRQAAKAHARGRVGMMRQQVPDLPLSRGCMDGVPTEDLPELTNTHPQAAGMTTKAGGQLVEGILAIDTDTEAMSQKFGNSTTLASAYIAALVSSMNVIYARDLGLRLKLGEVILRTGSDPYVSADSFDQLVEFGNWWQANKGGSPRAFAALLSGKSSSAYSANGIAWVLTSGNYCNRTQGSGGHYSLNRLFKFGSAMDTVSADLGIVAHEIGHNLGANHTHCTDGSAAGGFQPIDQCFNREASSSFATCYSGPEACPGGAGTLMSYCHVSSASCGPNQMAFHPVHIGILESRIASNTGTCLVPANDIIFVDGFEFANGFE